MPYFTGFSTDDHPTDPNTIKSDLKIKLKGQQADFRLIEFIDPDTGQEYQFITSSLTLKATEVAALYKGRMAD